MIGFVHIAKTAGSSVKFILRNSFGLGHCNIKTLDGPCTDEDIAFAKQVFFNLRSISGHSLAYPTGRLSTPLRVFTILRDPVERSASHYQQIKRHAIRNGQEFSFDDFCAMKNNTDRQVRKIAGAPDLELAKRELADKYFFVGLTERFPESMTILQELCPHRLDLRYPLLHVAQDSSQKKKVMSDPTTRRTLEQANELDQALYDFARDELFPQWRDLLERSTHRAQKCDRVPFPYRWRINRWHSNTVYSTLTKRRKRLAQKRTPAPA